MKKLIAAIALAMFLAPVAFADDAKKCEELAKAAAEAKDDAAKAKAAEALKAAGCKMEEKK